jgi:hypothetical protein
MDSKQKQKSQKRITHKNVLESLKDIGGSTSTSLKEDLIKKAPENIMEQLFGPRPARKYSGEISPGESLEFEEIFSGKLKEAQNLRKQLAFERKLREEEKVRVEKKSNELRVNLQALISEVTVLAETTQNLAEETQIAAMQAPVEPGVYHVIFFEKLIEFIKSFRKKIEEAAVWLHASNKRAEKKNYWARYKKHGGKFLLAADHYLTRSAG